MKTRNTQQHLRTAPVALAAGKAFKQRRMHVCLATLALAALASFAFTTIAAPPGANFNGTVSDIFVNNTQVLLTVSGSVKGSCTGSYGAYNLTFDIADPGAELKFTLIRDAFLHGKRIAGFVSGCGSSHINKLSQVSVF